MLTSTLRILSLTDFSHTTTAVQERNYTTFSITTSTKRLFY